MRSDPVQGILFDRNDLVEFARQSRHRRMLRKMQETKHRMQGWVTKPQVLSPLVPGTTVHKDFIIVRGGKHRKADLQNLAERFKERT